MFMLSGVDYPNKSMMISVLEDFMWEQHSVHTYPDGLASVPMPVIY
jgi:hypothetical protein